MTKLTTEQFADYFYKKVIEEKEQRQYNTDWFFDFSFTETYLPYDWDKEVFMNYFKERFDLKRIDIDEHVSRYRFYGEVKVECKIEPFNFFSEHI